MKYAVETFAILNLIWLAFIHGWLTTGDPDLLDAIIQQLLWCAQ